MSPFGYSYISMVFPDRKHADTSGQNHPLLTQSEPEYRVQKPHVLIATFRYLHIVYTKW